MRITLIHIVPITASPPGVIFNQFPLDYMVQAWCSVELSAETSWVSDGAAVVVYPQIYKIAYHFAVDDDGPRNVRLQQPSNSQSHTATGYFELSLSVLDDCV